MYCRRCGTQVDDGTPYCPKCGAPMTEQPVWYNNGQGQWQQNGYMQQPCYGGQPAGTSYTNGFAIAGFVLSFFFAILGLVFGIIGYKKSRLFMNSGKGLSIAAIAISIVSMALAVSLIIIATTKDYINPIYFKWY